MELCFTKTLEFASAPHGHRTPRAAWWRDAALERKSTSGASATATGPVSWENGFSYLYFVTFVFTSKKEVKRMFHTHNGFVRISHRVDYIL